MNSFGISARESFGFALSVGLVAVFIALFFNATPKTLSPVIGTASPSADSISMLNDANAAVNDINIHLAEISAFDAATQQTSSALSNINPSLINQEKNKISSSDVATGGDDASKIDNILNQLSQ